MSVAVNYGIAGLQWDLNGIESHIGHRNRWWKNTTYLLNMVIFYIAALKNQRLLTQYSCMSSLELLIRNRQRINIVSVIWFPISCGFPIGRIEKFYSENPRIMIYDHSNMSEPPSAVPSVISGTWEISPTFLAELSSRLPHSEVTFMTQNH